MRPCFSYSIDAKKLIGYTIRNKKSDSQERRKTVNNFVFENSSKVYFGKGCVKEYLSNILSSFRRKDYALLRRRIY